MYRGLYIRSAIFTQPNVVDSLGPNVSFQSFYFNYQFLILADILALAMVSILVIHSTVKHHQRAVKLTLLQLLRHALDKWLIPITEFVKIIFHN